MKWKIPRRRPYTVKLMLPVEFFGGVGCYLEKVTVDPQTGPEVCLVVLDSSAWVRTITKAVMLDMEIEAVSTQTQ